MKKTEIEFPELLYVFAFLLYLLGSSMTHIQQGVELSLWLMFFSVLITITVTTLPWLGINWLRLEKKGSQAGWWVVLFFQSASWACFAYAMYLRLRRDLPLFHTMITVTTLLWAAWILIFIYSRHANTN